MKKFISVILILVLCFAIVGCSKQVNAETTEAIGAPTNATTEPATIEPTTVPTTESSIDIPNAKEFPEITWPTFGIVTKVPTPDWSTCGEILVDSEMLFWGQVGYSTVDDFNAYVKACQDAGYIEDYYSLPGYFYYGADSEGRAVQLTYNEYDHYVAIQVTINAAEWNKWWVEEEN